MMYRGVPLATMSNIEQYYSRLSESLKKPKPE